MARMRRPIVALVIVLAACTQEASDPTIVPITATTSTTPAPTTTMAALPVEYDDCGAPLVTFSPLCETYELIKKWHVDRPPDPAGLADAALAGLRAFTTEETEDQPRALICAIPHTLFTEFCDELASRVATEAIPIGPAIEAAVVSMAGTGLDPFSFYVPPDHTGAFRANGVVGGVGVLLDAIDAAGSRCAQVTATCPLRIVFVVEDNPGAEAGLAPDDVIVAIDGEPVDGLAFVEAGSRIAGNETGVVELTIERDGETLEITITRAELTVPTVEIDIPVSGVGYLRIPDFESDVPDLVFEGLGFLTDEQLDTIVIDLRDNPGGLVEAAIEVISEFVDGGVIFIETDGVDSFEAEAPEGGLATQQRLIVLVNQGTASAGEVMAAALRDRRDATLVGGSTFGKNAVQIAFRLKNGAEFHLAVSRWLSPNGASVGDFGLIPDVEVDLPSEMGAAELVSLALEAAE